jgi:hypothetical protein
MYSKVTDKEDFEEKLGSTQKTARRISQEEMVTCGVSRTEGIASYLEPRFMNPQS